MQHRPPKAESRPFQNYADLFPTQGVDVHPSDGIAGHATDRLSQGASTFDPENDAIPYGTRIKQLSKLTIFAKELAEIVSVPSALRELQQSGAARLRFSRKDKSTWAVTEVNGDPYFRALLFETLNALNQNDIGILRLSDLEFDTIRIVFEYRTTSVVDTMAKPVEVRVDGNKVFLTLTHQGVDPRWQMLAVGPAGMPAINLIGVGMVLAKPYIERDPHTDVEVQRLRLSPAFIHQIGR